MHGAGYSCAMPTDMGENEALAPSLMRGFSSLGETEACTSEPSLSLTELASLTFRWRPFR
jgi:hypothetical protein